MKECRVKLQTRGPAAAEAAAASAAAVRECVIGYHRVCVCAIVCASSRIPQISPPLSSVHRGFGKQGFQCQGKSPITGSLPVCGFVCADVLDMLQHSTQVQVLQTTEKVLKHAQEVYSTLSYYSTTALAVYIMTSTLPSLPLLSISTGFCPNPGGSFILPV